MTQDALEQHISSQFNAEIEDVRQQMMHMGALVKLQIALAVKAFTARDTLLAEQILKDNSLVDDYKLRLDNECYRILALRQPTAIDLRLVISAMKIIHELEIIADLAQRIAKAALRSTTAKIQPKLFTEIQPLAELVEDMLHNALEALARLDIHNITQITGIERDVETEYSNISRNLIAHMLQTPKTISSVLEALWITRALERIGDHALHICEHLIFIVQGENVRHLTQAQREQKLNPSDDGEH